MAAKSDPEAGKASPVAEQRDERTQGPGSEAGAGAPPASQETARDPGDDAERWAKEHADTVQRLDDLVFTPEHSSTGDEVDELPEGLRHAKAREG